MRIGDTLFEDLRVARERIATLEKENTELRHALKWVNPNPVVTPAVRDHALILIEQRYAAVLAQARTALYEHIEACRGVCPAPIAAAVAAIDALTGGNEPKPITDASTSLEGTMPTDAGIDPPAGGPDAGAVADVSGSLSPEHGRDSAPNEAEDS